MINIPTKLWVPALTKPAVTFAKEAKRKVSFGDSIPVVMLAILIGSLLSVIAQGMIGTVLASPLQAVIALVVGIIFSTATVLVVNGIMYLIAKAFGGKGNFTQQFYFYSLFGVPVTLLSGALGFIPVLGGYASMILSVYVLWPLTLSIKQAHKLSTMKAVLAWLIPMIVALIISLMIGPTA
jgi:hypothetical protein